MASLAFFRPSSPRMMAAEKLLDGLARPASEAVSMTVEGHQETLGKLANNAGTLAASGFLRNMCMTRHGSTLALPAVNLSTSPSTPDFSKVPVPAPAQFMSPWKHMDCTKEPPSESLVAGEFCKTPSVWTTNKVECNAVPMDVVDQQRPSPATVESISGKELAALLVPSVFGTNWSSPSVIVLDCRSFMSFNANHVTGAFNAACADRFARKRLLEGRAIADLVCGGPGEECDGGAKEQYRRLADEVLTKEDGVFIVYDDNTTDLTELPATHPLRVLTNHLRKNGHPTKYLSGGLHGFHAEYSTLCSKPDDPPSRPLLFSPTTPSVEQDVDSAEMSEILPYLFIGNERDAANRQLLADANITHVLNVTSRVPLYFENDVSMTYLRIPASDSGSQDLKQYFDEIVSFIESARSAGGRVLIHCQAGVSRSPTLGLAYIMARYNQSVLDAFAFVKSRRPIIAPNFNFMGQLLDFERRCSEGELTSSLTDDVPPLAPLCTLSTE